jgi:hypothetical protein
MEGKDLLYQKEIILVNEIGLISESASPEVT